MRKALYQKDLTQKQVYELKKIGVAQARVKAEIEAEEERAIALGKLQFDDPDKQESNEKRIRASKQRTATLTLIALNLQRQVEQGLAELIIKGIQDRSAADKRGFDARKQQLTEEQAKLAIITRSIERQTQLKQAQTNLDKAQTNVLEVTGQIEVDKLNRALELRQKLNDKTTDPAVRRVLRQQLEALTGNPNTSEVSILQTRIAAENQIQAIIKNCSIV